MRRTILVILAGLAMVAGVAGAGQTVVAQDGTVIDDAVVAQTGNGSTWVRNCRRFIAVVCPGGPG